MVLGALGTAYGSDVHVGSSSDPSRSSPAGAIYAIPLDNGRQDGSPTGDHGGQGISSIHSENGYGSSTVVPGVLASSASGGSLGADSHSGHGSHGGGHRNGSGKAAGATGSGPGGGGTGAAGGFGTGGGTSPSALASASAGHGPPSLPSFALIVLIGGVAGVIGVTASRALRG
jgi:hypothetical protein